MKCIRNNQIKLITDSSLDNCKIIDFDVSRTISNPREDLIPKGCIQCHDGYKGYINNISDYHFNRYVHMPLRNFSYS